MDLLRRLRRSATIALIASPTGLLLIAVVRLLIISNYNPVTASEVVSSGGYVNTLLGTVIPVIPIFLPYAGLVLLFFRRVIPGILTLAASALISPAAASGQGVLEIAKKDWQLILRNGTPLLFSLAIVAGVAILATVGLGFNLCARTIGTVISICLIPYVILLYPLPYQNSFYTNQLRALWLPAETITLSSHNKFVGYTLSSDSDWLVVLRNDSRQVIFYPASKVTGRQVCQIGRSGALKPIITLTAALTSVPVCVQSLPRRSNSRLGSPGHRSGQQPTECTPIVRPVIPQLGGRVSRCP